MATDKKLYLSSGGVDTEIRDDYSVNIAGDTMTGALKCPTPAAGLNDTTVPTTAWCNSAFVNATGDTMSGALIVNSTITSKGDITVNPPAGGSEGGQINLIKGTDAANGIIIDTTGNALRVFGNPNVGSMLYANPQNGTLTWNGQPIGSNPTGTIIWVASASAPTGYIACNGGAVSRSTYAALFTAIGTNYGAGDGSTTFNLPNLIDRVPWGGTPSGTSANNYKEAGVPNITGGINSVGYASDGCFAVYMQTIEVQGGTEDGVYTKIFNAMTGENHGTWDAPIYRNDVYGKSETVQPPATVLLPCIKI